MALKLSLKPGEKLVVNGAVIANGDRRATLVIKNKVSILREKDILQAEDVDTPAKRIYFAIQMMYIDERSRKQFYEEFMIRMTEFLSAVQSAEGKDLCLVISQDVMSGVYYKAMMTCRKLIAFEKERLEYAAGLSANPEGN